MNLIRTFKKIKLIIYFFFSFFIAGNLSSQEGWTLQYTVQSGEVNFIQALNTQVCWFCGQNSIIYKTTNGGTAWLDVHGNIPSGDYFIGLSALDENYCIVYNEFNHIYKTTNGGTNWNSLTSPISNPLKYIHMFDYNTGWALGDPTSMQWQYFITSNGGQNWVLGNNAPYSGNVLEQGYYNGGYSNDTGHLYWGCSNYRIYHGSLRGLISYWTVPVQNTIHLAFNKCFGSIVTSTQAMTTPNCSIEWNILIPLYCSETDVGLTSDGLGYYWVTNASGIHRSIDGITFSTQLSGYAGAISMVNAYCGWALSFINPSYQNIYKYRDPNAITINNRELPTTFSLSQNYPNPFNPSTKIKFDLPSTPLLTKEGVGVILRIYDILGCEIATLVNEKLQPGSYEVDFDGTNYPSGVYFYKLETESFTETKKMILIK